MDCGWALYSLVKILLFHWFFRWIFTGWPSWKKTFQVFRRPLGGSSSNQWLMEGERKGMICVIIILSSTLLSLRSDEQQAIWESCEQRGLYWGVGGVIIGSLDFALVFWLVIVTGLNLKTALSRDYSSVIVCREEIRDTTLSFSRGWHFSCALACSASSN